MVVFCVFRFVIGDGQLQPWMSPNRINSEAASKRLREEAAPRRLRSGEGLVEGGLLDPSKEKKRLPREGLVEGGSLEGSTEATPKEDFSKEATSAQLRLRPK